MLCFQIRESSLTKQTSTPEFQLSEKRTCEMEIMRHQTRTVDHICNHILLGNPCETDWKRQAAGHFHNISKAVFTSAWGKKTASRLGGPYVIENA